MDATILKIAIPALVASVLSFMMQTINIAYIGHLGDTAKVAGIGLGVLYSNIFCISIIIGINYALTTFVSQAFGSGNLRKCGIYLNKGRVVTTLVFIPLALVLLLCEDFLLLIKQDP